MERIGPYKVIGEIGRGGMGVVLRGLDPAIGRAVAIKVILLQEFSDPKDREMLRARLFREAQAAGILNHPGIVTVYYVGEEGENAFIAMEYVNGPSLEKVLNAPQPPGKETLRRVLWQTAAALDYAHSKGIIHRDIKPANIMLDESGAVKICDFGIAKGLAGQTALTQAGTSLGSPFYMSPEQIQGGSLDHRTDQYSLGVVAYEALTGKRPFQSVQQIQSLFFHIMNEPPLLAYQVNPALSPGVSEVLQKALAKDPAARYPSCTDFVRALLEEWDAAPAPSPPHDVEPEPTRPTAPAPPRSGARAKLLIAGLAAAAAVAALGIGAFYWARVRTHPPQPPVAAQLPLTKSTPSGDMVLVPAGQFLYGKDKSPRTLPDFYIDKTEVTNAAYGKFCKDMGHPQPPGFQADKGEFPVVNLTIVEAREFANWAGKRLPTAQEWEKAARGTQGWLFPWGDQRDPGFANVRDNASLAKHEITLAHSFLQGKSPSGALNMVGNVWEFIDKTVEPIQASKKQWAKHLNPPPGPQEPWYEIRGESFNENLFDYGGIWDESAVPARGIGSNIGFRCVKDATDAH